MSQAWLSEEVAHSQLCLIRVAKSKTYSGLSSLNGLLLVIFQSIPFLSLPFSAYSTSKQCFLCVFSRLVLLLYRVCISWGISLKISIYIFFLLYNRYIYTSFIHKYSLRPFSISSQLSAQWAEPPWGAMPSRDPNSGPALQQASWPMQTLFERNKLRVKKQKY